LRRAPADRIVAGLTGRTAEDLRNQARVSTLAELFGADMILLEGNIFEEDRRPVRLVMI